MISIPELQALLMGMKFEPAIHTADQFGKDHGDEIVAAAEIAKI